MKYLILSRLKIGCTSVQTVKPMPDPPRVTSDEAKNCVMQCQQIHNDCIQAPSNYYTKKILLNQRADKLRGCDSLCEE